MRTAAADLSAPPIRGWQLLLAVLLPVLALALLQSWELRPRDAGRLQALIQAYATDTAALSGPQSLPLRWRGVGQRWLEFTLPAPGPDTEQLLLVYRPMLEVYLDGQLLRRATPVDGVQLGQRRLRLELPPALHRQAGQRLQLKLVAPGASGASLQAPLLGSAAEIGRHEAQHQRWQLLRGLTAGGALLAALFLSFVAWVRRDEPLYRLAAAHVALLGLLLMPYLLPDPPLPPPWWRMLLDGADLLAKALLLRITAQLAGVWRPGWRRWLIAGLVLGLLIDATAAVADWRWSNFAHPWAWWALGSRALLLAAAWGLALRALRQQGGAAAWGTALLVGFSAANWVWISLSALVLERAVIDSHALAYAGWVLWVVLMLQRHFVDGARRDADLQRRLGAELAERSLALQRAFEAQALAERERAAAEQRRRLLQDLHDGLGARLLQLRIRVAAGPLDTAVLQQGLDDCLLEMRLSVDTLAESDGDLGVLLGSWRQRVEATLRAADVRLEWRVRAAAPLPCLRGAGGLELVRWLQEALSNALRHGQPRHLLLATQWVDAQGQEVADESDAQALQLWFIDDGHGLPAQPQPGQGLRSLQARAQRLGAELQMLSPVPPQWLEAAPGERVGTALGLRLGL